MKTKLILFSGLLVLFIAASVHAGRPNYVGKGNFYRWKDGKIKIWFDPGGMSHNVSHEEAKEMITEAFKEWEGTLLQQGQLINDSVKVSGVKFLDMGNIPGVEEINDTNYRKYYFKEEGADDPSRPTVIIFDKDGEIMADLVLEKELTDGQQTTVLGITDLHALDDTNKYIINGTIILNGPYYESVSNKEAFKAAIRHELGHLLNLDHSAINDDCHQDTNCANDMDGWRYLPTMYRYAVSGAQKTLHRDDIAWAAFLYLEENEDILREFCTVTGDIFDKEGRGFQGAQITAYETGGVDNPRSFGVTAISGALYPACKANGKYFLIGLRPGKTYGVQYGPIPDWCEADCLPGRCNLVTGINPYAPPRPLGVGYATVGGSSEFVCEEAGDIIEADPIKLVNVNLDDESYRKYDNFKNENGDYAFMCGPAGEGIEVPEPPEEPATSPYGMSIKKKGWCSLVPGSSSGLGLIWFLLPAFILAIIKGVHKGVTQRGHPLARDVKKINPSA